MRVLILAALLGLAACASGTTPVSNPVTPPPPPTAPTVPTAPVILPTNGPILYTCDNGAQLTVTYRGSSALVAVVGGVSMNLPNAGSAEQPFYSNGRFGLRGRGALTQWQAAGAAPTTCRGS